MLTLDSVIDLDQGINVGKGKFDKKNKHVALNKHRAWKIWQKIEVFIMKKQKKIFFQFFILNLINVGSLKKAVGPGEKSKINKRRAYVYPGV